MREGVNEPLRCVHRGGVNAHKGDARTSFRQLLLGDLQQSERVSVDVVVGTGRDETRQEVGRGAERGLGLQVGFDEVTER
jgi:hypothetical protein